MKLFIYLYLFHDWFSLEFVFIYSISLMWWEINFKQIFTKVNQKKIKWSKKDMSCKRALNFDQWKRFFKNYKPMTVWLWLVYKFIETNCHLRLFSEFIQTQKRYPTSLDKISVLTQKLLAILSQNFSYEINSQRTYSLQNISYLSMRL